MLHRLAFDALVASFDVSSFYSEQTLSPYNRQEYDRKNAFIAQIKEVISAWDSKPIKLGTHESITQIKETLSYYDERNISHRECFDKIRLIADQHTTGMLACKDLFLTPILKAIKQGDTIKVEEVLAKVLGAIEPTKKVKLSDNDINKVTDDDTFTL